MTIQRLTPRFAGQYREVMLEAYERHPEAFTSSASERAALPLTWWEARLEETPRPGEVIFGALESQALVGVVGLAFENREKARHKATLIGMYVRKRSRGHGLGGQLVTAALAYLATQPDIKLVQLTVTDGNTAAQALYERFGFAPFGIEPMAIAVAGGYVSKVHMWRRLDIPLTGVPRKA